MQFTQEKRAAFLNALEEDFSFVDFKDYMSEEDKFALIASIMSVLMSTCDRYAVAMGVDEDTIRGIALHEVRLIMDQKFNKLYPQNENINA